MLADGLVGSSPSLTITTFFSSFAHHNVPSFNLKRGEAQTGHERSVKVAPCISRSAMRLIGVFSFFSCNQNPKVNTYQYLYNLVTARIALGSVPIYGSKEKS